MLVDTIKVTVDTCAHAQDIATKQSDGKEGAHAQFDKGAAHMEFMFTDHAVHKQVLRLLLVCAKRQFTKREMASCRALLQELVIAFFKLTPNFIDSAELVGEQRGRDA